MVIAASLLGCGPLPAGDPARPDIVLVSIDSLRSDHLSSYGYNRQTTPGLDELAAGGLRFTAARAASPWTLPSHMTMLTGLWPMDHQVIEDDLALRPEVPMVQQALQAAGWATGAFVSTYYVGGGYGFSRGFSKYNDYAIAKKQTLMHAVRVNTLVDDTVTWMKEQGGRPAFVFLHIYDVHYPYLPPEPWNALFDEPRTPEEMRYKNYLFYKEHPLSAKRMRQQVAQYDESLAWVDHELARLRNAWDSSDRPVTWIVTSDHGEELGERGSWGHAHTLYPEALDIPLVIAGPGLSPQVRTEGVGTIDLAPTIAGLAGVDWPAGPGVDLRAPVPARTFYAETSRFDSARLSVASGDRRLDLDLTSGRQSLYDTVNDPAELHPVEDPAVEASLSAALWGALGGRWTAEEGVVRTSGWLLRDGAWSQAWAAPASFLLYPLDAKIYLESQRVFRGVVDGPPDGPLRYAGKHNALPFSVSDATKAQLEALGYLQGPAE